MARKILGIVLGIVAAFAVVMSMDVVGHKIWPPPKDVNFTDAAQVAAMMDAMPAMAFQWLLLGWVLALTAGVFVARWASESGATWVWVSVAVLFLASTILNLFMIPHPQWFTLQATAVLAIVLSVFALYFRKSQLNA